MLLDYLAAVLIATESEALVWVMTSKGTIIG
jgi:hypothetical protein